MHEPFIQRTFELALKGKGSVSPNPMVGAVLVKNGKIIGEGFHPFHGGPHAEVECFKNATEDPTGATLYVNLEPCCHTKKLTPPCAPLIIEKKIARLVVSNLDPNPQVSGLGIKMVKDHGIEVITGVLEAQGARLNEVFFHRMKHGSPFIHLKAAITLDGKIAFPDGTSKWITNAESRRDSHEERLGCDAILVGAETIRQDDPQLTVRLDRSIPRPPWRIVVTQSGKLPQEAQVFKDALGPKTLIVTGLRTPIDCVPETQVLRLSSLDPFAFNEFYQKLQERGIYSLWVEGGSQVLTLFAAHQEFHRLTLYIAPKIMGAGRDVFGKLPMIELKDQEVQHLGVDLKISGRPRLDK